MATLAGYYAWNRLAPTAKGKEACCEDGEDCAFRDFIEKEGKGERLECATGFRDGNSPRRQARTI
ncbi:MAG: hypothetical protein FVQ81_05330 [Candidatus Glassbacteria bacterium]|nr:hypothetical protein [Candidatus Glassbacteria bacterium]